VGDRERARQQATARCEPGRGSFAPCFSCCPRRPPTRAPSAAPLSGSIGWPKLGSAQAHLPSTRASLKQSALQSRWEMPRLALLPTPISPGPFFGLRDSISTQHWHLSSTRFGSKSSSPFPLMAPSPLSGPRESSFPAALQWPGQEHCLLLLLLLLLLFLLLLLLPLAQGVGWPHSLPCTLLRAPRLTRESSGRKEEGNASGTVPALHG